MLKQYNSILVAVDGSKEAESALNKAVDVAKRNNATLYIVHVIDMRAFESMTSYDETLEKDAASEANKTLKEYTDYAHNNGLTDVIDIIEVGIPKRVLSNELQEKYNIDLIMLGATGLNTMERILIGSVSSYVARHATCDVLIVRTDMNNNPIKSDK
ncbi:universal stress protein [Vagococcus jeotgali]|uniref:universal stress protein n=1 Tax=Vagococcus jeotgali TaxID=3109030 RepID=UPI002DD7F2E9|nr:universal stress protein [Vagococcus sp. B2T-5]